MRKDLPTVRRRSVGIDVSTNPCSKYTRIDALALFTVAPFTRYDVFSSYAFATAQR
jgi:hypothetical protein